MRATIWGCRGSVPTPGPETVGVGGNTSCVEVSVDDGSVLVLDAGTGIIGLGHELRDRGTLRIHLILTHLHLDHLEGLRFFGPLWDDRVTLEIWGPPSPVLSLQERISRSFSPPLFPVDLRHIPARVSFHDLPRQPWTIGRASLTATLVVHPGPTVGVRIDQGGSSFAYLPDHEPALAGIAARSPDWISGAAAAEGADVLVHDAQYLPHEYEQRLGWGHSSVDDAVAFAHAVGARELVLFHHEPTHSDEALRLLEDRAQSLATGDAVPPVLAREGMVLELS